MRSWLFSCCTSTVVEACLAGSVEPVAAAGPDGVAVAVVFVGGGDVADRGVQPEGVVLGPDAVELSFEVAGVGDLLQVRPLGGLRLTSR